MNEQQQSAVRAELEAIRVLCEATPAGGCADILDPERVDAHERAVMEILAHVNAAEWAIENGEGQHRE